METPQSINQSSTLRLVQNENLKKLLDENSELKEEYNQTSLLVRLLTTNPTTVKSIGMLNTYLQHISNVRELVDTSVSYRNKKLNLEIKQHSEQMNKNMNIESRFDLGRQKKNIGYWINKINNIDSGDNVKIYFNYIKLAYIDLFTNLYFDYLRKSKDLKNLYDEKILYNNDYGTIKRIFEVSFGNAGSDSQSSLLSEIEYFYDSQYLAYFLSNAFQIYAQSGLYKEKFKAFVNGFIRFVNSKAILVLLSNPECYNFFPQWHKMLEKNLPQEDKQLFYDYLDSCKNKLQIERNRYNYFYEREWVLTGIFIFGIIASATVLTIYFMEIYAAIWFFWFGMLGIVLTVAVGIRLGYFLLKNYNEIKSIDCAIDVYDLDKIRNFEKPEPKKISTFEANKNKIILNNDEINSTEQNDAPESEQDNSGENIKNINNL